MSLHQFQCSPNGGVFHAANGQPCLDLGRWSL